MSIRTLGKVRVHRDVQSNLRGIAFRPEELKRQLDRGVHVNRLGVGVGRPRVVQERANDAIQAVDLVDDDVEKLPAPFRLLGTFPTGTGRWL